MKIEIDEVINISLTAIYSNDLLKDTLFLKGGQYLRVVEKIKNRFSADMDFSTPRSIDNHEVFFEELHSALIEEFYKRGFYLFSFKPEHQPKLKKNGAPDHWSGWAVSYKIVSNEKRNLSLEKLDRSAIIPKGSTSPKIQIDISEYEYCGNIEKVKINGSVEILSYSRTLVILEKIRAICQQHPNYPHKKGNARPRDYYDIERLWGKVIEMTESDVNDFVANLKFHLAPVFLAKEVDLSLLDEIFDSDFIEVQKTGWSSIKETVDGRIQPFDYYLENLKNLIKKIRT